MPPLRSICLWLALLAGPGQGADTGAAPNAAPGAAPGPGIAALREAGFTTLWAGYAVVTSCGDGRAAPTVGPYLFACDAGVRAHPNHFGTVAILVQVTGHAGARRVRAALCLDGGDCLPGRVYRR